MIQGLLEREISEYGDIIMGNFIDSYRNLTYKHLMSYQWVTEFCAQASYLIKADDDIIMDVFHAIEFLSSNRSLTMDKDYYCYIFAGTHPIVNKTSKWTITPEEFPGNIYPDYCGFAGYIVGVKTLKRILAVSTKEKYLFIDDVFISGILRDRINREEKDPKNKVNIIVSHGHALGYDSDPLEKRVLKKELLTVVEESRTPGKSCYVWDLFLKTRNLADIYVSTCNALL